MQYKVPQNIDLEDKIVGPFTMKQFLYLFFGGFIVYGWWSYSNQYVNPMPIFLALAIPLGLLCFCLAIIKINDRPFEIFLLNLAKFIFKPKQRKWKTGYIPEAVITMDPIEASKKKDQSAKTATDLDSLAKTLEHQNAKLQKDQPAPQVNAAPAKKVDLAVNNVAQASSNQQQAQPNAAPVKTTQAPAAGLAQKKGILSIFK